MRIFKINFHEVNDSDYIIKEFIIEDIDYKDVISTNEMLICGKVEDQEMKIYTPKNGESPKVKDFVKKTPRNIFGIPYNKTYSVIKLLIMKSKHIITIKDRISIESPTRGISHEFIYKIKMSVSFSEKVFEKFLDKGLKTVKEKDITEFFHSKAKALINTNMFTLEQRILDKNENQVNEKTALDFANRIYLSDELKAAFEKLNYKYIHNVEDIVIDFMPTQNEREVKNQNDLQQYIIRLVDKEKGIK
jgi:hypothetical protein